MLQHADMEKENTAPSPDLNKMAAVSEELIEQFKALCQELGAVIIEEHMANLRKHGSIKMSFEFPDTGKDVAVLKINNGKLIIGRYKIRNYDALLKKLWG